MATVVLVPMAFSPTESPAPPAEVSVAAAGPGYALIPDDVRAGAYAGGDQLDVAVAAPAEPATTTAPPAPTTEATVQVATTTTEPPPKTTTTTVPSTTTTVQVARAEEPTTAHAHSEPPPDTTTTEPPPPPPADDGARTQEGQASWYDLPGARAGVCAHRTIAKGTLVTVTNVDTGKSITCTVDDRGPYAEGKIIDLYRDDFARLAPLEQGVFPARITW